MNPKITATALALAIGLPLAMANAQTTPTPDPHHPPGQAAGTPPAGGQPAVPLPATPPSTAAAPTSPQTAPPMGMMMGDMRQMMQMMQQMMQMMGGGGGAGSAPGAMAGSGMPMMQMMPGGPGMAMGGPGATRGAAGSAGEPMMFKHVDGILAFYKAELRITEAQTPQWNTFADAARAGAKAMRETLQRVSTQQAAQTMPEQIDRRLALLTMQIEPAKTMSSAAKALYAVLTPEQRKLADEFMAEHMKAMRGLMP